MIWTGRDGSEGHNVLSLPAMSRYMNDGRRGGLGLDETNLFAVKNQFSARSRSGNAALIPQPAFDRGRADFPGTRKTNYAGRSAAAHDRHGLLGQSGAPAALQEEQRL